MMLYKQKSAILSVLEFNINQRVYGKNKSLKSWLLLQAFVCL